MANHGSNALLVTQYYRPELIGSGPFCGDLAEFLVSRGERVVVLAGLPHYPHSEVFPAYRGSTGLREVINGLAIERVRSWIPRRRSALHRILSEGDFLLRGAVALLRGRVARQQLVISLCPSILAVALGIAATGRGGRHVAIVHDIQSGLARGLKMAGAGLLGQAMRWCERAVLNRVDVVVVLSEEMRAQLIANGVRSPIAVVPIWVDTDTIRPLPRPEGARTRLLYSGNLGRKQGLGQVVALAEELRRRGSDIEIVLRGDGSQARELAAEVADRGLDNVRFVELLPRERLSEALAEGDIHLVPQEPEAAEFAVPSKVFGIMAAARPFIATAYPASPLARLRDASGAFICVAPGDTAALTDAVLALAGDERRRAELGRRGRAFVEQYLAKPRVLGNFVDLLHARAAA